MGMLMHHTWLEQQKQKDNPKSAAEAKATEKVAEENDESNAASVRKPVGRRKVIK